MFGLLAALIAIFNQELPAAVVSTGALISFALIEAQDIKNLKDKEDAV